MKSMDELKICNVCSYDKGKTKCTYKGSLHCEFKEYMLKQSLVRQ